MPLSILFSVLLFFINVIVRIACLFVWGRANYGLLKELVRDGKRMNTGSKVTWEGYRGAAHFCGEKIWVTKIQIEFKLSRTSCEGKQKGCFGFYMLTAKKDQR